MTRRSSFLLPSINHLLAAAFIGLLVTWLTKDTLFPILTGTPLSIRRPLVQAGFIIVMTAIVAVIVVFIARRPLDWLLSHAYLPFFFLPIIPLAAHGLIGTYSRFVADDFSSATLAVNKGILGATWDWYVNWSGRFSASYFDSLFGYLGPSSLRWVVLLTLVLLMFGLTIFTWQFLKVIPMSFRLGAAVFLPAATLVTAFRVTPDLPQSLYWGQGMRSLVFPLVPAAFLMAILAYLHDRPNQIRLRIWYCVIALISFVAGGFGETYIALQTTFFLITLALLWFIRPYGFRKPVFPAYLIGLFFSFAAMAVTIAAPGNGVRQSYFKPSPDIFSLVKIAFNSTIQFLQRLILSFDLLVPLLVLIMASLLLGWLCAKHKISEINTSFFAANPSFSTFPRSFATISILSAIILVASYVPAAYGMSSAPPDRTVILPTLLLCASLCILGFLSGNHLEQVVPLQPIPTPWLHTLVWLLFFIGTFYTYQTTSHILTNRDDYRRFARVFDRADRLIREAKAAGKTSVQVPEVHNHFGLSDFGAGTTYWLDSAVDSYYGIHVIVNKNMK